ncbi:MAG: CRISPR-associated endonuclease Cas6 [candidate division WOR-3 bacterium]
MRVHTAVLTFGFNEPVFARADRLRGFFATHFGEFRLVHHHLDDNRLIYRTPLIQYKVVNRRPLVVGLNEGAEILRQIYEQLEFIRIGRTDYRLEYKRLYLAEERFGETSGSRPYTFLSPWLALNEQNYQHYVCAGSPQARRELLERILVGNILSVAKGLGYTVTAPLTAELENIREVRTTLKGTPMLGFLGNFRVNFEIPEFLGLGKSVSRGFGTIGRL